VATAPSNAFQKEKTAGDTPAAAHAGSDAAPVVTREACAGSRDQLCDLCNGGCVNTGFSGRKLERIFGVDLFDLPFKIREIGVCKFPSSSTLLDEVAVVEIVRDQVVRNRQQDRCFGTRDMARPQ
jgi:hypothetical protein